MRENVILVTVPGLRAKDVTQMPALARLVQSGDRAPFVPSFPCVSQVVQGNMFTGQTADEHGVVGARQYDRETNRIDLAAKWADQVECPQIWEVLRRYYPDAATATWNSSLGKPPCATIQNSDARVLNDKWCDSVVQAIAEFRPIFTHLQLNHLDRPARLFGPDSDPLAEARRELDDAMLRLTGGIASTYPHGALWLVASEYVVTPVHHTLFPNRLLREAGLLQVERSAGVERIDFRSAAWTLADQQCGHVFVRNQDPSLIRRVADLFRDQPEISEALVGDQRAKYNLVHDRSGEIVIVSTPDSWQSLAWWQEDASGPPEFSDAKVPSRGSHGAPANTEEQRGVLLCNQAGVFVEQPTSDYDIADLVLRQFGI